LEDAKCPVFTLAAELMRRGWTTNRGRVVHVVEDAKKFDSREALRMRWYYHVLLGGYQQYLVKAGGSIPSQEPMSYYRLLLAGKEAVAGLPAKTYLALLSDHHVKVGEEIVVDPDAPDDPPGPASSSIAIPLPGPPPQPKRRRCAGGHGPIRPVTGRPGSSGTGGPVAIPLPPDPPAPPTTELDPPVVVGPPGPGSGAGPGHGSGGVAIPEEEVENAKPRRRDIAENAIPISGPDGCTWIYNEYPKPGGGVYKNWQIDCAMGHPGCHKTRGNTANFTRIHGLIEPPAYLLAWRRRHWIRSAEEATHLGMNPSREETAAVVAAHRAELEAAVAMAIS